jgi:tetratricopeptide (TPR) repeat protein
MRAIDYSWDCYWGSKPFHMICFMVGALFYSGSSQTNLSVSNVVLQPLAVRIEDKFRIAQKKFHAEPRNNEAAWQFARAAFDAADAAKDNKRREQFANEGIAACRQVIQRERTNAAAHYYLAMNLGELAQTKLIGALKLVNEIEREFSLAASLDPKFDYAGPERNLGLLYLEAPGWPASIGNRGKAKQHLLRAVELAPNYPENHLILLEAYLRLEDVKKLYEELKVTEELWPKAKKEFAGEEWASSWADWEKRLRKIKSKVAEFPKPMKSPADKN